MTDLAAKIVRALQATISPMYRGGQWQEDTECLVQAVLDAEPPSVPVTALRRLTVWFDDGVLYQIQHKPLGSGEWIRLSDLAALIVTADTSAPVALIDRLENHYDFQCEGGPLKNCAEWQQLKAVVKAEAQVQQPVATTECCSVAISVKHRYCPRCGWECRLAFPPVSVPPTPEEQQ